MTIKPLYLIIAAALIFGGYEYMNHKLNIANSKYTESILSRDSSRVLADGTVARLAVITADRDSLKDALKVANDLNATLVAAANIHLKPDTSKGRDTTTTIKDKTRTLAVNDSGANGRLVATVTAPPFPANLAMDWTFYPAPLDVTVSLLQLADNQAIFAVRYRGGSSTITAPFAKLPPKQRELLPYVDGLYDVANGVLAVRAGVDVKVPFITSWYILGEAQQKFQTNGNSMFIGVHKTF